MTSGTARIQSDIATATDHHSVDDDEVVLIFYNVIGCRRHIRDKLKQMPKHGSVKLYVCGSQKVR